MPRRLGHQAAGPRLPCRACVRSSLRGVDAGEAASLVLRGVNGQVLKGHLDMLLLAAVRDHPAHGYTIIENLRQRSGGAFDLAEGTVYPALHRLEAAGLLQSQWAEVVGRRRRVYRLSRSGHKALREGERSWRQFVLGVQGVLGTAAT